MKDLQKKDFKTGVFELLTTQQYFNNSEFSEKSRQNKKKKRCCHRCHFHQCKRSTLATGVNVIEPGEGNNKKKSEDRNQNCSNET